MEYNLSGDEEEDNITSNLRLIWNLGEKLRGSIQAKTKRDRLNAATELNKLLSGVSFRQSLARELEQKSSGNVHDLQRKYESLWQTLIRNAISSARLSLPSSISSTSRSKSNSARGKKLDDVIMVLPCNLLKYCDAMRKQYFIAWHVLYTNGNIANTSHNNINTTTSSTNQNEEEIQQEEESRVSAERSFLTMRDIEGLLEYALELLDLMMSRSYTNTSNNDNGVVEYNESIARELWSMLQFICSSAAIVSRLHPKRHVSIILHECARVLRQQLTSSSASKNTHREQEQWIISASKCQHNLLINCLNLHIDLHQLLNPLYTSYRTHTTIYIRNQPYSSSTSISILQYLFASLSKVMLRYTLESVEYLDILVYIGNKAGFRLWRALSKRDTKLRGILLEFYHALM